MVKRMQKFKIPMVEAEGAEVQAVDHVAVVEAGPAGDVVGVGAAVGAVEAGDGAMMCSVVSIRRFPRFNHGWIPLSTAFRSVWR